MMCLWLKTDINVALCKKNAQMWPVILLEESWPVRVGQLSSAAEELRPEPRPAPCGERSAPAPSPTSETEPPPQSAAAAEERRCGCLPKVMASDSVSAGWDKDVALDHHFHSVLLLRELLELGFFTLVQRLLVLSLFFGHQWLVMLKGAAFLLLLPKNVNHMKSIRQLKNINSVFNSHCCLNY